MSHKELPNYINEIKELVFDPCDFKLSNLILDVESLAYHACSFEINSSKVVFRTAKITPTKNGQFVTLWKRIENGPIQPYTITDSIDLFIINTRRENNFGQFVFPKLVLEQKGIISNNSNEGKRAIRVYPPWDLTTNKQAQKTQKWQLDYFIEIPLNHSLNIKETKLKYSQKA